MLKYILVLDRNKETEVRSFCVLEAKDLTDAVKEAVRRLGLKDPEDFHRVGGREVRGITDMQDLCNTLGIKL